DTGAFIKELRATKHSPKSQALAAYAARHFSKVIWAARGLLAAGHVAERCIGAGRLAAITRLGRRIFGRHLPEWNTWLPRPAGPIRNRQHNDRGGSVVYFPACVSRIFGVSGGRQGGSQTDVIEGLFTKAGVRAIYPQKANQLCCGMAFASKGFFAAAEQKMEQLISELVSASQGVHPILIDTSPCASRLRTYASRNTNLRIYDISEFLLEKVVPRVHIQKARG